MQFSESILDFSFTLAKTVKVKHMKAELTQRGVVSVCLRGGGCGQYCKLVFGQLKHFLLGQ